MFNGGATPRRDRGYRHPKAVALDELYIVRGAGGWRQQAPALLSRAEAQAENFQMTLAMAKDIRSSWSN